MKIPKGEIIEARAGGENALRELLEHLKEDFSGYIEVVGEGDSLGQILFFDGRPRLALFESDSRYEGREAISRMIEISKEYDTEIKVHRYPMVALLLDRFPEAEVTEEALGMPKKKPVKPEEAEQAEQELFNRREELASVLGTEPAFKPAAPKAELTEGADPFKSMEPEDLEELREGLIKRLNLEKFYKKKEA